VWPETQVLHGPRAARGRQRAAILHPEGAVPGARHRNIAAEQPHRLPVRPRVGGPVPPLCRVVVVFGEAKPARLGAGAGAGDKPA